MKNMFLLTTFALITSCGGASNSDSPSTAVNVIGVNLTGTYDFTSVQCFNSTTLAATESAALLVGTSTITINGNSLSSTDSYSGCSSVTTANVTFTSSYNVSYTSTKVISATGNSCTSGYRLSNSPTNSVSPKIVTYLVSTNLMYSDYTTSYIKNTSNGSLGLLATQTTSNPSDICYLIYTKR